MYLLTMYLLHPNYFTTVRNLSPIKKGSTENSLHLLSSEYLDFMLKAGTTSAKSTTHTQGTQTGNHTNETRENGSQTLNQTIETLEKGSQTETCIERMVGRTILEHCPNRKIVTDYVKYHTMPELTPLSESHTPPQKV